MTSSPTTRLRFEQQGTGENLNTWGVRLNAALALVDEATAGVEPVTVSTANVTLTSTNYVSDQARNAVLVLTGTLDANRTITAPTVEKLYLVVNNCTQGAYSLTIKTAAGSGYVLRPGPQWVFCDGSDFARGTPRMDQLPLPTGSVDLNSQKITGLAAPASGGDATNKTYVDTFAADRSAGGFKLTNLAAPTSGGDAVNKTYTDAVITTAAASASAAATSATNAATSATAAATSATAAATSATSAASSATAAATSETNAAASAAAAAASAGGGLVKVTTSDTTASVLDSALTVTAPLTKTVVNPGANETLNMAVLAATESASGVAEIATQAEVDTGTDDSRIVTALKATEKFLAKAGGAMAGAINFNGNNAQSATLYDTRYTRVDKGNSGSSTITFDVSAGNWQKVTVTGSPTFALSNWPSSVGAFLLLEIVNGGSGTITWPTISFIKTDGTTQSSPTRSLQSSGTDFVQLWRNGTTVYGKVI